MIKAEIETTCFIKDEINAFPLRNAAFAKLKIGAHLA